MKSGCGDPRSSSARRGTLGTHDGMLGVGEAKWARHRPDDALVGSPRAVVDVRRLVCALGADVEPVAVVRADERHTLEGYLGARRALKQLALVSVIDAEIGRGTTTTSVPLDGADAKSADGYAPAERVLVARRRCQVRTPCSGRRVYVGLRGRRWQWERCDLGCRHVGPSASAEDGDDEVPWRGVHFSAR